MEALLCGRPAFAIGETRAIGLVTEQNLDEALASNFGDIGPGDLAIDFAGLKAQIPSALASRWCQTQCVSGSCKSMICKAS